jgi:hypothetical protein
MQNDKVQAPAKRPDAQRKRRVAARIVMIAAILVVAAIVLLIGLQHKFTVWAWLIYLYLLLAASTFVPVLWAILFNAELHDDVPSFAESPLKDNKEAIHRLQQHYKRIFGTLIFWKSAARRNGWFHYYCVGWTIFSTAIIPFLTQAIDPADSASKWLD